MTNVCSRIIVCSAPAATCYDCGIIRIHQRRREVHRIVPNPIIRNAAHVAACPDRNRARAVEVHPSATTVSRSHGAVAGVELKRASNGVAAGAADRKVIGDRGVTTRCQHNVVAGAAGVLEVGGGKCAHRITRKGC